MQNSLYVFKNGTLSRKDNTLCFVDEDGEKRNLPIENIKEIFVMSEMQFNTSLLNIISKYGITMHYYNYYNFYIGSFYPRNRNLSGNMLIKQVAYYTDYDKRLDIAKRFIKGASANIYRNLRYYNGRGKNVQDYMDAIEEYRKGIDSSKTVQELMGYEGNIRKKYYEAWPIIINQDIEFDKRVMHPPDNMVNSLISFVNSLIYSKTLTAIYQTQLDPTISYLHEPGEKRYSLCLDISEIFKPLIGDRLIFSLLNKNQITSKNFTEGLNGLHLDKEATKIISQELEKRLSTTVKHKDLNRDVSYQYLLKLEVYKLIKHLLGEKEYQPFEIWW